MFWNIIACFSKCTAYNLCNYLITFINLILIILIFAHSKNCSGFQTLGINNIYKSILLNEKYFITIYFYYIPL